MKYLDVELKRIALTRGETRVLRNVSWRVRPGQRWALLGHNGAGKTQLLKLLAGDVWPEPDKRALRRYRLGKQHFDQPLGIKERIAYVGAERQDRYARYGWDLTVTELVSTGLFGTDIVLHRPDAAGLRQVRAMNKRLGLEAFADRKLLTMSYGERRLALIARALVARPQMLLLDEVFNGLDGPRRDQLLRVLERSRRSQLPWVLSAHRPEDIPRAVTHVLVLEKGKVVYSGRRSRVSMELAFPAPARSRRTRARIAPDARIAPERKRASVGGKRIELKGVDVYVEHHLVLQGIDWILRGGEHWAVTGRNGSGKSTFLRLLYGDLPAAAGGVVERAGFVRGTHIEEFKRTVGFLSPELQSDHAREDLDVQTIIMSGRYASIGLNDKPTTADRRAAEHWLEFFGLSDWAARRPRELSYGQMRRVLLARAVVNSPRILLLDEPCTGLDSATRAQVLEHLEQLARSGVQLVMATHHWDDLVPAINRVLQLKGGRVLTNERRTV